MSLVWSPGRSAYSYFHLQLPSLHIREYIEDVIYYKEKIEVKRTYYPVLPDNEK